MKLLTIGIVYTSLTLLFAEPKTTVLSIQCWLEICGNSNEFTWRMYRLPHEIGKSTLNLVLEHFPGCNQFGCRAPGRPFEAINFAGKFQCIGNIKNFFLNKITIKLNSSSKVYLFATVLTIQDVIRKILCRDQNSSVIYNLKDAKHVVQNFWAVLLQWKISASKCFGSMTPDKH